MIEMVIYMAILAVVSILVVGVIIMMMRAFGRIKVGREIDDSAQAAMGRMINEIRYATSTSVAASTFGSGSGKLILNTTDRSTLAGISTEFSLSGGAVRIKEGGGTYQNLTSGDVQVTALTFNHIVEANTSEAIKIQMTITATRGSYQKTANFYDTAVLRGSYWH